MWFGWAIRRREEGGPIGSVTGRPLGVLMALLAVQEMVLAGHLILKGYSRQPAAEALGATPDRWHAAPRAA